MAGTPGSGVVLDWRRNLGGRGAWVCPTRRCIGRAVRRRLFDRALKQRVSYPSPVELIDAAREALNRRRQTLIGTGLQEDQASITLRADPEIRGRYSGTFEGTEQGVPVTIDYFWQVITDEYIVGYLTASVTAQGVTCTVYRPFELTYTG